MADSRFRNLTQRALKAGALVAAALLLASCTTGAWGDLFYGTARNICDSSARHCDGGYQAGNEWTHPGGTAPKPNLPRNAGPY